MADQVTNYQCPACTGPLHFDGKIGKLKCDYCGSTFTAREIEKLYKAKNESAAAAKEKADKKAEKEARKEAKKNGIKVFIPDLKYCTDNAAMVASQGFFEFKAGNFEKNYNLNAVSKISF